MVATDKNDYKSLQDHVIQSMEDDKVEFHDEVYFHDGKVATSFDEMQQKVHTFILYCAKFW